LIRGRAVWDRIKGMNYIVLVKQVPDIRHIPDEAWDWEKGHAEKGFSDQCAE